MDPIAFAALCKAMGLTTEQTTQIWNSLTQVEVASMKTPGEVLTTIENKAIGLNFFPGRVV